ncbi:MAG: phage late control D family protein [Spirochaetaceae bacterium]|jgi:hypothetical protein|nr:phage late control D family protein [Spirochaetaceae bacterium]
MSEATNILELRPAGDEYADLYPWDLILEEGFSRLYRAKLTAISDKKHTAEELASLVDKKITIVINEKLMDRKTLRTRYLHGIVTEAGSAGVFCSGVKKDCYVYRFIIEPALSRLRFTRLSMPYYKMNPADIFEQIIAKYNIKVQIESKYFSRGEYGKNLMFNQTDLSDIDFIERIAGLYGLPYTFKHPAVLGSALGTEELYFSNGEKFPVSEIVYSDKRKEPGIAEFDFLSADESLSRWRMDKFSMSSSTGVDGFKLNAVYPSANYGSEQWKQGKTGAGDRCVKYSGLFHGYDVTAETGEIDDDIKKILMAQSRAADIAKTNISGEAANILVRPGIILELKHFYGAADKTINIILVTGIRLHLRTCWRPDLAVLPEAASGGEVSELEFSGMDWGRDAVKRFCPPVFNMSG